jgi:hypothetical protein
MGKISVSYYLNTKLKPTQTTDGKKAYPVYIRVLHKRVLSRINSVAVNVPVTEKQFENLQNAGIKRKFVTETSGIKLENGIVTETNETKTEYVPYNVAAAMETERNIIVSFFEFADKYILDFIINKSKTSFGDLIDYYANCEIMQLLEWVKTDFIPIETRWNMQKKLKKHIVEKTGFSYSTAVEMTAVNVGLHAKSRNGKSEFISLGTDTINDFRTAGILTDKEAGAFEFINLLTEYNFNKYRLPVARKGKQAEKEYRVSNPHEFLTVRVWLREKPEILRYVAAKASPKTREFIAEYAEKAEKTLIDLFKKQYFEGLKSENSPENEPLNS